VSWTVADIPDLTGRVAVVTGANGGLGLETARALAGAGATVVMAARNQEKAVEAEASIRGGAPGATLEVVALDLGSLASVREAAGRILAGHDSIDILVNNAGVMGIPERSTVDGFEMQFGVDHLGHFALTALLMPALLRADAARVVTVTSTAHHMGRAVNPDNPHLHGRYGPWRAYGQAKLANFHFGLGLDRDLRSAAAPAASLIAHPGLSNTELQAVSVEETGGGLSQRFFHVLAGSTGMSAATGALSQLRAATDPDATGGQFYGPLFVNSGAPVRKPVLRRLGMARAIARLWEVSERETGVKLEVGALSRPGSPGR
jgi:NAD(P)-dependent dehydrogenase (short-subunit alcohol dehydrogenase family)